MSTELWRQWQALFPFAAFGGDASPAPAARGVPGLAEFAESAERFAEAFREFLAAARREAASPGETSAATAGTAAAAAAEGFGNFLREHYTKFLELQGFLPPGFPAPPAAGFSDGPAVGLGREQLLRAQRAAEAWNRIVRSQARLQRMLADTLRDAATAFASWLPKASADLLTAEAVNRMYDRWIDCAEEVYARTVHREDFCDALSDYVNAGSEWRRESLAQLHEAAKLWDFPTRAEVNTLTLRIRELEAELLAIRTQPQGELKPRRRAKRGVKRRSTGRPS